MTPNVQLDTGWRQGDDKTKIKYAYLHISSHFVKYILEIYKLEQKYHNEAVDFCLHMCCIWFRATMILAFKASTAKIMASNGWPKTLILKTNSNYFRYYSLSPSVRLTQLRHLSDTKAAFFPFLLLRRWAAYQWSRAGVSAHPPTTPRFPGGEGEKGSPRTRPGTVCRYWGWCHAYTHAWHHPLYLAFGNKRLKRSAFSSYVWNIFIKM